MSKSDTDKNITEKNDSEKSNVDKNDKNLLDGSTEKAIEQYRKLCEDSDVELTEKQHLIRDAVDRILADEDPRLVARELLETEIVTAEDINSMIEWIKTNRGKRKSKGRFRSLRRRGAI